MRKRKRDPRRAVMIDVALPASRKLRGAPVAVKWLDVVGVCWSGQNMTDGEIDPIAVCALAGVPNKHANDLVKRGRWHKSGHDCPDCPQPRYNGDVVIHHYLVHQTSSLEFEQLMEAKGKASRIGNHKKYNHEGPVDKCGICNK